MTEYVPGPDLRKLVRNGGPLTMESAASIISQVAAGLEHAHQRGLIHRDVKPGNVLVTPRRIGEALRPGLGWPFGRRYRKDPRFGRIVGTADYLSPDHIQAPLNPTPAWDIYALGCTLYYAVTGKVPFPGGSTADKASAHCELRPLDPLRLNPNLNSDFIDVMADMMAKNPAERIHSASEVIERLARWVNPTAHLSVRPPRGRGKPRVGMCFEAGSERVVVNASRSASDYALKDTASSFPELPDAAICPTDNPSQLSQITQAVASAGEDTCSDLAIVEDESSEHFSFWGPFAVLVALPSFLVAVTLLIWWFCSR